MEVAVAGLKDVLLNTSSWHGNALYSWLNHFFIWQAFKKSIWATEDSLLDKFANCKWLPMPCNALRNAIACLCPVSDTACLIDSALSTWSLKVFLWFISKWRLILDVLHTTFSHTYIQINNKKTTVSWCCDDSRFVFCSVSYVPPVCLLPPLFSPSPALPPCVWLEATTAEWRTWSSSPHRWVTT